MPRLSRAALVLAASCAAPRPSAPDAARSPPAALRPIALAGLDAVRCPRHPDGDARCVEASGLAWRGDELVILPQFPARVAAGGVPALLTIPRARIEAYLAGRDRAPVAPARLAFRAGPALDAPGFQGFEAIAFDGDRVWVTIETEVAGRAGAFLATGAVGADGVTLAGPLLPLPTPADLPNTAHEAIALTPDGALVVYEANGAPVRRDARALLVDRAGTRVARRVAFPALEYRVTDATALDAAGTFWVANYFYPGDTFLAPDGAAPRGPVEQFVELRWSPAGVARTARAPVALATGPRGRNWEGLARLPGRGLLAVTDEFPRTILALVPLPDAR